MVTLVIYGLIAIALAASAGYAFLTFTSSARQMTQLQENQVRMDTAVAALRASLLALSNDGVAYAPEGVAGPNYMQVPTSIGVVSASPWGQPYLYCPISQTGANNPLGGGNPDSVKSPSGATYSIGTYSNVQTTQGNNYVITSSGSIPGSSDNTQGNAAGYVAFIVSTLGPGQTMPDCSQISISASGLRVPGGSVRGVTAGFSFLQRVSASSDRMELYVGADGSTGNGSDKNNLTSLDSALALWGALKPRLGMIYLETNASAQGRNFNAQDIAGDDIQAQNETLVIETDPNIVGSSGPVTLTLPNAVKLAAATTFQNVNVVTGGNIFAYKGLTLRNQTAAAMSFNATGNAANNAIEVFGSDLTISDTNVSAFVYTTNARVVFLNYRNNIATTLSGALIASNSNVSFDGAPGAATSFTVSTYGPNFASIVLSGSTMTVGDINIWGNVPPGTGTANVTSSNGQVILNSSHLYVYPNATFTVVDTTDASHNPMLVYNSDIDVDFSSVLNITASNNEGIKAFGSNVTINGTYKFAESGNSAGAIGIQASVLSGMEGYGAIQTPAGTSCVDLLHDAWYNGSSSPNIPIYVTTPNSGPFVGYANFAQAQRGYPPLLAYTGATAANTSFATTNITPTTSSTWPSGNDPIVTSTVTVAALNAPTPATGYVDPATFEAGVRTIMNGEFISGNNLYFLGTCTTY